MGFTSSYILNLPAVMLGYQPVRPLLFSYYITHRCNLNCRYCCDGDGKRFKEDPIPELSTAEAKRLVSILRGAADTLDITGGEPMLRNDLEDILAHARQSGFRTVLNTKGIGIEDRPDILSHTSVLVLSLDTIDPGALANVIDRPQATADRIISGLEFAIKKHKETGTKVILSTVATPANLDHVAGVLHYALDHSLGFHVSPEIVGKTANPELRNNERYQRLIDEVLAAKEKHCGVLGVPGYLRGIRDFGRFHCHPLLMPTIRPDGRLYYPCLENKRVGVNLLEVENYPAALGKARREFGEIPACQDCCHLFCHMALSLLQREPLAALGELRHWGI